MVIAKSDLYIENEKNVQLNYDTKITKTYRYIIYRHGFSLYHNMVIYKQSVTKWVKMTMKW